MKGLCDLKLWSARATWNLQFVMPTLVAILMIITISLFKSVDNLAVQENEIIYDHSPQNTEE